MVYQTLLKFSFLINSKVGIFFIHKTFYQLFFRYRYYLSVQCSCKSYQVSLLFLIANALGPHYSIGFGLLFFNFIRKWDLLARLLSTSFFFWDCLANIFQLVLDFDAATDQNGRHFHYLVSMYFCSHLEMKMKTMVVMFAEQTQKVYFGFPGFFSFSMLPCSDSVQFKYIFHISFQVSSSFSVFLSFSRGTSCSIFLSDLLLSLIVLGLPILL